MMADAQTQAAEGASPVQAGAPDLDAHAVMGAALVERGIMTAADVAADRAAIEAQMAGQPAPAGTATPQASPQQAAQAPAEEVKPPPFPADIDPADAIAFAPPPSLAAYDMTQGPAPAGTESSHEFEMANRQAFYAAGIPQAVGNHMAKLWNNVMARGEAGLPNDTQLELSRREALSTLSKQWGAETQANLARAKSVVALMEKHQPAIWQMLEKTGLGNDPWLISTLANLARVREPKAKG